TGGRRPSTSSARPEHPPPGLCRRTTLGKQPTDRLRFEAVGTGLRPVHPPHGRDLVPTLWSDVTLCRPTAVAPGSAAVGRTAADRPARAQHDQPRGPANPVTRPTPWPGGLRSPADPAARRTWRHGRPGACAPEPSVPTSPSPLRASAAWA